MYLVGHTAVGVATATALGITNPIAALGIGWLTHYAVDFLPHGDEPVGRWAKRGNEVRRIVVVFLIDVVFVLAAFAYYLTQHGFSLPAAFAAFGATIPDIFWGLDLLARRQLFGPLSRFHFWNHNHLHINLPLWLGIAAQAAATSALWWWAASR